jgi:hypothetical protein
VETRKATVGKPLHSAKACTNGQSMTFSSTRPLKLLQLLNLISSTDKEGINPDHFFKISKHHADVSVDFLAVI